MSTEKQPQSDAQIMENKLRLMETDRKNHFESSQVSLKQNTELIRALRRENKELSQRTRLAKEGAAGSNAEAFHSKKVVVLDSSIHSRRRQLDELRAKNDVRKKELARLGERMHHLHIEAQPVYQEDSQLDRKIRMLENRLDKSMIKYNEALSIRRTYEQIVRRLKDERVGFDNQLAAIERTLKAKDHDYHELLNMSHDAAHAKDIARVCLRERTGHFYFIFSLCIVFFVLLFFFAFSHDCNYTPPPYPPCPTGRVGSVPSGVRRREEAEGQGARREKEVLPVQMLPCVGCRGYVSNPVQKNNNSI